MLKRKGECPCGGKTIILKSPSLDLYIEYCTVCDWIDVLEMFDGVVMAPQEALEGGIARKCPFTGKICPAWMINDYGMSIEYWHKIGKGSLTV